MYDRGLTAKVQKNTTLKAKKNPKPLFPVKHHGIKNEGEKKVFIMA